MSALAQYHLEFKPDGVVIVDFKGNVCSAKLAPDQAKAQLDKLLGTHETWRKMKSNKFRKGCHG